MGDASTNIEVSEQAVIKPKELNVPEFRKDLLEDDPNKGGIAEGASLEELSIDPITGLLTRGIWVAEMKQALEYAKRNKKLVAVAMLDVDGLKVVNDTKGHAAGDKLLKNFGFAIRQRARKSDILGRYGGDEAVAMMPDFNLDEEETKKLELKFSDDLLRYGVNVSVGIAKWDGNETLEELLKRADDRMYLIKEEKKSLANE